MYRQKVLTLSLITVKSSTSWAIDKLVLDKTWALNRFMVIFLNNAFIFKKIQYGSLVQVGFASEPSNQNLRRFVVYMKIFLWSLGVF